MKPEVIREIARSNLAKYGLGKEGLLVTHTSEELTIALKTFEQAGFVVLPKEELEAALKPFGKVVVGYDYWSPEVMPAFQYPVPGTRMDSALTDEPDAIGALHESDFRRVAALLAAITQETTT